MTNFLSRLWDTQGADGFILGLQSPAVFGRMPSNLLQQKGSGYTFCVPHHQRYHRVNNGLPRRSSSIPTKMKGLQENPEVSEPRIFVEDIDFFKRVVMEVDIDGQTLRLESGEIGRLAAGAVTATQGDSVVYATACADLAPDKEQTVEDFVPLSVHYQERSSAAGKTSGGYIKRDSRPSDEEVLVARIIDRTVRPIFPPGFCREVCQAAHAARCVDLMRARRRRCRSWRGCCPTVRPTTWTGLRSSRRRRRCWRRPSPSTPPSPAAVESGRNA